MFAVNVEMYRISFTSTERQQHETAGVLFVVKLMAEVTDAHPEMFNSQAEAAAFWTKLMHEEHQAQHYNMNDVKRAIMGIKSRRFYGWASDQCAECHQHIRGRSGKG